MKNIYLAASILITAITVTFTSCKKETPDTETQSAVDNNICETEFSKSMTTINSFAIKENGIKSMLSGRSSGPVVTTDTTNGFPRTMTIDYGTGVYDSIDHKTRKGQIICYFSNYWRYVNSFVKVNLINYSVNGNTYACDSMKITHSGTNAYTHQVFKGKCTNANWSLQWETLRTFEQTAGAGDLDPYNDVFKLNGNSSGVNRDGKSYTVNVTSPIVKRSSCSWVESGRLDITPQGLAVRTVDYGNGTCDNQATLTINGNTFTFTMN